MFLKIIVQFGEVIADHPIASITALATLIYASILFWDRWTDKANIKIKDLSLEKLQDNFHISVEVMNEGRKTAHDTIGYLEVFDEDGRQIELNHPEYDVSEDKLSMVWVPNPLEVRSKYKGKIGNRDLKIRESKSYSEETRTDIAPGGHNFLRLARIGMGQRNVFENLKKGITYQFKVTIKTTKSDDDITKEGIYPDDFKEKSVYS